ncbi:MAG: STAS-like domain-containing protein [Candidatus Hydrogenedentes bacterium]|nr:STAS-like domain-containing protein [Candidatus Hydrogenedentota bacterium]
MSVYDVVASSICVASGDGDKVFSRIRAALNRNAPVSVSFRNVSPLSSAFLDAAFGQLFGQFSEEKIQESIRFEHLALDDRDLLKRVMDTAKVYHRDPERFEKAIREALGEYEDEI